MTSMCRALVSSAVAVALSAPVVAQAPSASPEPSASAPLVAVAPSAAPTGQMTVLPANTELLLSMNDDLTTKGGGIEEGTTFGLTVVHDVRLGDFVVIPKGARGVGEVTWKTGKGAFGKSGKMEIELRYVEVGNRRVPIEGKYRQEGEGNTVATIGTVLLAGVFAGFVTGKSAKIPRGRELAARTREAIPVMLPVAPAVAPAAPALAATSPAVAVAPASAAVPITPSTK